LEQIAMRAPLHNPSAVENQHLVGAADRAQAVSHDKARASVEQLAQGLLNAPLGEEVD